MGNLGSVLGFGGGNSGSNFQAANVALTQPATQDQANASYANVQNALAQQQAFVNALNGQGGIGNQSNALLQQQALANQLGGSAGNQQAALAAMQGLGNQFNSANPLAQQQNTFAQQQALAGQLQAIAAGQGANPAQAMLNQNTGANVANQAALMAGQRGVNANVGLMGREIAQQGANTQQQAVGQGATLQAQQSLAAMQQQAAQQQAMQQVSANQLAGQQANQGQVAGLTTNQLAAQQAQQQAIQGAAQQQVANQGAATGNLNSMQQNQYGQLLNSLGNFNQQQVAMQSNINSVNGGIQGGLEAQQGNMLGGLMGGAGLGLMMMGGGGAAAAGGATAGGASAAGGASLLGGLAFAHGGVVDPNAPQSFVGKHIKGLPTPRPFIEARPYACGGTVMKSGGEISGKAKVKGDSLKNDTVKAKLSPGEIVIPRSITMGKDPINEAAKFVAAVLAHSKGMTYAQTGS